MSFIPFRFSLIGGMIAPVSSEGATNRRTFWDFSPKGPTPTAGLSAAHIPRASWRRKQQLRQPGVRQI